HIRCREHGIRAGGAAGAAAASGSSASARAHSCRTAGAAAATRSAAARRSAVAAAAAHSAAAHGSDVVAAGDEQKDYGEGARLHVAGGPGADGPQSTLYCPAAGQGKVAAEQPEFAMQSSFCASATLAEHGVAPGQTRSTVSPVQVPRPHTAPQPTVTVSPGLHANVPPTVQPHSRLRPSCPAVHGSVG